MLLNNETLLLLKKKTESQGYIELPAEGNSMYPFIQNGNICHFDFIEPKHIKKGDIILFHSEVGKLVAHRFHRMEMKNGHLFYILKGDSNLGYDAPVMEQQIIGRMASIQRNNKQIKVTDYGVKLWTSLVLSWPLISGVLRMYLNRKYQN
ncbi:signal peptidase I [Bacillus sp. T3]|uniref:signal peptidase I n=1 Tax=Bacillus sp. T3 TaxID=467262 RepID=UPI0029826554|nr:signal peptidase I [Bacillus sp. T3]